MVVELPYGRTPLRVDFGGREVEVVRAIELPPPPAVEVLVERALDATPPSTPPGSRVTLIVSDSTRREPRAELVAALRRRLPGCRWTLAIATGTHGPCRVDELGIPDESLRDMRIVNHDGARCDDIVELGTTRRGTPVRVHRCVVEAELVIATGCIRPHYFAGFGAGTKAIFPGLGETAAIRTNHRLKTEPSARAGVVAGNPCREDIDEAVAMVATPKFLINGVCGPDGAVREIVCGDMGAAFERGCELARPWFRASARPARLVVASDALPVTASLYQAAKIAAAAAPLVAADGALVIAAECAEGIGPLDVVNDAIFRIGVLPRLARGASLHLVSSISQDRVVLTLLNHASSVEAIVELVSERIVVIPRASQLLLECAS